MLSSVDREFLTEINAITDQTEFDALEKRLDNIEHNLEHLNVWVIIIMIATVQRDCLPVVYFFVLIAFYYAENRNISKNSFPTRYCT